MSTGITPVLYDAGLSRSQKMVQLTFPFVLTAGTGVNSAALHRPAKTAPLLVEGGTGSALTAITQATADAILAETNGVLVATAFGTSAMVDNNTYAFVINTGGQVLDVGAVSLGLDIAGTQSSAQGLGTKTALANSAFTGVEVYVTPGGNLACRVTLTNISAAATAGSMVLRIDAYLK